MRNGLKRAAAFVMTVLMLLALLPAGLAAGNEEVYSSAAVPGLSDGGALRDTLLGGSGSGAAVTHTVTFHIGQEAQNAGVQAPAPLSVEEGQAVGSLPVLTWSNEDGSPFRVFSGWYTDEACTDEFTKDDPVAADMTVYAQWVDPQEEGRYFVNFYSFDGAVVHLTLSVEAGKTVNPAQPPVLAGKVFRGWSKTMQGASPVTEVKPFDFSVAISEAVEAGSNTVNLYAWYGDEVNINFVSNGGTAVPTQIIAAGETITTPDTTREGYTFRGWSTSNDEYLAFNFENSISADMTLYAFWDANLVPVTLVYMLENANDDGYSPAGHSQRVYVPAGSYVSIDPSDITRIGQTHAIKYATESQGALTGNAADTVNGTGAAVLPDVHDGYYQYHSASDNRFVMPDGSTVMLVYYKRARVTLTFIYNIGGDNTPNGTYAKLSGYSETDKYRVAYTEQANKNPRFTYSFTAKYRQDITPVWPQIGWVDNDSSGRNTFYTWRCPDDHDQSSNMYTLESSLFMGGEGGGLSIKNGELVGSGTLYARATGVSVDWLIYARTTLPGETADFTYDGQNYTIYREACQQALSNEGYGYKALDGCTPIDGEIQWSETYEDLGNSTSMGDRRRRVSTASGTMRAKFESVFGAANIEDSDRCQVLLYDRNTVRLSLHVNDDIYQQNVQTKDDYLYGDWIYNDSTDLLKIVEANMMKKGYRFAGWYTDPNFTDGTQYVPDADSRINGAMDLYAKWEPDQFKAEFYLYMDDVKPYREQGFAEGGTITDWTVPPAVQDSFVGWYWYQNGKLQPFDFTSTVGSSHVDENGVLKLYARWKGTNGKVSYLPGIGGDNATQEVYDGRVFAINDASVELQMPAEVWTDGSVPGDAALIFVGWKAPNGAIHQPGRYVLVTRALMQFEAQWAKDAVTLIYKANGGTGGDVTETWARNSDAPIWDNMDATTPHFTRNGYELIGWDADPNATDPTYKIGEGVITLDTDKTLYAIWQPTTCDVTISKVVTGNMGDRTKQFSFSVTCTDPMANGERYELTADGKTATFTLQHGQSVMLMGVKKGAVLTITEANADGYEMTVSPNNGDAAKNAYTVPVNDETTAVITVTNEKNGYPDTGILLDNLPYILILACVIGIGVVAFIRRRRGRDDDE